jgi:hypothetical protein
MFPSYMHQTIWLSVHFCRPNPKTKILQLLAVSYLICVPQLSVVPDPLSFIIPFLHPLNICAYWIYQLCINARFRQGPAVLDSAPEWLVFPKLTVMARPMFSQNFLRFTSLVWRTCYRDQSVASMALNGLHLINCFKRLTPHWWRTQVPSKYLSGTLPEHRTTSLKSVDHYWRTLCMHKGLLIMARSVTSHCQTKDAVKMSIFKLLIVHRLVHTKNTFRLCT